ncbi:hypothetical protein F5X99DRAFT_427742 [Biscogniauxia marginata]|nr:hypothetical protein F5X99DRAFT_427742 [Biscogniauxia marginata]
MTPIPQNLFSILLRTAQEYPHKGISVYLPGQTKQAPKFITYRELLDQAISLSRVIESLPQTARNPVLLIHLNTQWDNILWFWACTAAGKVPAMSTPFSNDLEQRKRHLLHLKKLLSDPILITSERLIPEFASVREQIQLHTIETLVQMIKSSPIQIQHHHDGHEEERLLSSRRDDDVFSKSSEDLAALMLTSGSTGDAKAVGLRHGQVIAALHGKSTFHQTSSSDVFLSWVGMDHVANLTEIHLQAMFLGAEQVQVQAADMLVEPLQFLRLIGRHRVSYSFAPNFFLASLRKALGSRSVSASDDNANELLDVSSLRLLISGGEANSTALCVELASELERLGAPVNVIRPGFGMTETCAGSIYNAECPALDVRNGWEFTSLGHCIPGMAMRVVDPDTGNICPADVAGTLEVSGQIVFREYYNNPQATAGSFTPDGWFRTGDLAFLDSSGNLNMVGRQKETLNINGLKYHPHEIEAAIEDARIEGVKPSFTAVFPFRAKNADTETFCIVYLPTYEPEDAASRIQARNAIRNVAMRTCMARPHKIIPLDQSFLHKSSLGKLSRSKIQKAFGSGVYDEIIAFDEAMIARGQRADIVPPSTPLGLEIRDIFADVFGVSAAEVGVHTNMHDLGCSSLEVFRLKWLLESKAGLPDSIPVTTIISNPTIESLSQALDPASSNTPKSYDPVVVLRSGGTKTPLWLVHPGMGEVLVFFNLARQIVDRPVYALRARGFDGEPFFGSIDELVSTYLAAIKKTQPTGPYAIAGYSYGGTMTFEIAKRLHAAGDETPFLAVIDQRPHIKGQMRQSGWSYVLLTLVRFFDLLPDPEAEAKFMAQIVAVGDDATENAKESLVDSFLALASSDRLSEYGLDKTRLFRWTGLALNSHAIARDYEPTGHIPLLEVFYGDPMEEAASSRDEWLAELLRWNEFVDDVKVHPVEGHHFDLIAPAHVISFSKALSSRLQARGI